MTDASNRPHVSSVRWYIVALGVIVAVLASRAPMMFAFLRDATEFVVTWRYDGGPIVARAPRNDNDQDFSFPGMDPETGEMRGDPTKRRRLNAELEAVRARGATLDYCILGAGPGGIQTATYLLRDIANVSLVVLEKRSTAGSFFQKFPIHRRLISINKRAFTKKQRDTDFQMRHDWNSLIDPDDYSGDQGGRRRLLMQNYSTDYYPHASDLATYLDDWASQKLNGYISFDTEVRSIRKQKTVFHVDTLNDSWKCRNVISATGLHVPKQFSGSLAHPKVIGYESLSRDPVIFEGKRVAIIGAGNAAFEAASAISKVSAHTDIFASSAIKFAHQTHYPGAVRIPNAGFLDQYLLKSLDSFIPIDTKTFAKLKITEAFGGSLVLSMKGDKVVDNILASGKEADCKSIEFCFLYDYIIRAIGWTFDDSIFEGTTKPQMEKPGEITKRGGKYPSMTAAYESTNVPGLYFAGAVSHALDFGESAGGFIHGFRYTSRALTRYLNVHNHGGMWPMAMLRGKTHALMHVSQRVNTASSLYQMYGTLADVFLIDVLQESNKDSSNEELIDVLKDARYFEDVPLKMVREGRFSFNMDARFLASKRSKLIATVTLEFGKDFHGRFILDHGERNPSNGRKYTDEEWETRPSFFLHPVLRLYRAQKKFDSLFFTDAGLLYTAHLEEELTTDWSHFDAHKVPIRKFLRRATIIANRIGPKTTLGRREYDGDIFEGRYEKSLPFFPFEVPSVQSAFNRLKSTLLE
jgi:thioredoxin reductase